jgi:hypothetical protein
MSCLGPNYNPNPERAWSRVQNQCTYLNLKQNENSLVYIPILKKYVPLQDVQYQLSMINKGNVLQYKCNSANITKSEKYSLIAKGAWNRKKSWATQTQSNTEPNTNSFKRINYYGFIGIKPNTPDFCQNTIIPNGGSLNARLIVNQCNGEVIQTLKTNNCFPTTASNVPGRIMNLCYDNNIQTWYPKLRYYMNNSNNKFPQGYKYLISANGIKAQSNS